jgi:hypothetical protein
MKKTTILMIGFILFLFVGVALAANDAASSVPQVKVRINCIFKNKPIAAVVSISEINSKGNIVSFDKAQWKKNGKVQFTVPKDKSYRITAIERSGPLEDVKITNGELKTSQDITNVDSSMMITLELHDNILKL